MPTAIMPSLSEEDVEELLYCARLGELQELIFNIEILAKSANGPQGSIVSAAIDKQSGNGILHMASANGHSEVLKHVITMCTSLTSSPHSAILNCQNVSGNTPLHWASLNDHLESVKVLIHAGADPTIVNRAGHDAVYEAEINGKEAVAQWLLTEGKGLETGFKGSRDGSCIDETAQEQKERAAVQEDLEHVSLEDTL